MTARIPAFVCLPGAYHRFCLLTIVPIVIVRAQRKSFILRSCCVRFRMKGQMLTRLNHVAAVFRKVSHQEMADTTKRTIQENAVVASQLGKMAERSVEIDQENVNLKDHTVAGCRQIREMEAREKELARNYVSSRKVIICNM